MLNIFLVGLPSAYWMAITLNYGINGLWYGEIIGFSLNLIGYSYLVFQVDWSKISESVQDDMEKEMLLLEDDLQNEILQGKLRSLICDSADKETESTDEDNAYFHPFAT